MTASIKRPSEDHKQNIREKINRRTAKDKTLPSAWPSRQCGKKNYTNSICFKRKGKDTKRKTHFKKTTEYIDPT